MTVLSINNLTKNFGRIQAVRNLSLAIEPGQIYGFLGPNGSGKTTTLGMLLGVVTPSEGSFSWFQNQHSAPRKRIGSLLEQPNFYPWLSGKQNLRITAAIKGKGADLIDATLDRVGLGGRGNEKFQGYSLGMRQRLALAAVLIAEPDVLVLDEPTNGVDAQGFADIRNLIKAVAAEGKTVILASHILDEVEKVCSHVAVMRQGELLVNGPINQVLGGEAVIEVGGIDFDQAEKIFRSHGIEQVKQDGAILTASVSHEFELADLNRDLVNNHQIPNHLVKRSKSLETQFLELLKQ